MNQMSMFDQLTENDEEEKGGGREAYTGNSMYQLPGRLGYDDSVNFAAARPANQNPAHLVPSDSEEFELLNGAMMFEGQFGLLGR